MPTTPTDTVPHLIDGTTGHILFTLLDRSFAFPVKFVTEVARPLDVCPSEGGPGWLKGTMRLRKAALPIIDLTSFLGLSRRGPVREAHVLIVRSRPDAPRRGLLVHRVQGVRMLTRQEAWLPPALRAVPAGTYLHGVAAHASRSLFLLAIERLLAAPDVTSLADPRAALEEHRFMKALASGLKWLLVIGVFVGPVAFIGSRTLRDDQRILRAEQRRLTALEYLQGLRDLAEQVQRHRTVSLALLSGDKGSEPQLPVILDRIEEQLETLTNRDESFGSPGSTAAWHTWQDRWEDLRAHHLTWAPPESKEAPARTPAETKADLARKLAYSNEAHARLLGDLQTLAGRVADDQRLTGVTDHERQLLLDDLTSARPSLLETLGQAQAVGLATARQESPSLADRGRLLELSGRYHWLRDQSHARLQTVFALDDVLRDDGETAAIRSIVDGDAMFDLLARNLLSATPSALASAAVDDAGQKALTTGLKVYDAELDAVVRLTRQQVAEARRALRLHAALFLAVLVFVLGGVTLVGYGMRRPARRPRPAAAPEAAAPPAYAYAPPPAEPSGFDRMLEGNGAPSLPPASYPVTQVLRQAGQVSISASQLQALAELLAHGSDVQGQYLAALVPAVERLTAALRLVSTNAILAVEMARQGHETAHAGTHPVRNLLRLLSQSRESLRATAGQVGQLAEHTRELARVTALLDDVSEWTSLLALNAGIQAAQAGPEGERWAIIAANAERLAGRALAAVSQMTRLEALPDEAARAVLAIEDAGRRVTDGSLIAQQVSQTLTELGALATRWHQAIQVLDQSLQEQARNGEDVQQALKETGEACRKNGDASQQMRTALSQLAQQSDELRGLLGLGAPGSGSDAAETSSHMNGDLHGGMDDSPSMIHVDQRMS